jgi:hypothetical protein
MGTVLIMLGVLLLLEPLFGFRLGAWLWPFFIIIPGMLFFVGMLIGGASAGPLAIPGSIVTTVGLLLFYQNTVNHFESWAYAWALIPAAVGIGVMIDGAWSQQPALIQNGRRVAAIGLGLFLAGFCLFELALNRSRMAGGIVVPLLVIAAGIYVLLRRARPAAQPTPGPAAITAPPIEPAAHVSSPSGSAPAAPAETELAELLAAAYSDEPLNGRDMAAHE